MKHINRILNIVAGAAIGVFLGNSIFVFWEYKTHPGLYAMRSAPWYTGILVYGIFTVLTLLIVGIIKWILKKYTNSKKK